MKKMLVILMLVGMMFSSGCYEEFTKEYKTQYISDRPELDNDVKRGIMEGSFTMGMTPYEVVLSIGRPRSKYMSSSSSNMTWSYYGCSDYNCYTYHNTTLYFKNGILVSYNKYNAN